MGRQKLSRKGWQRAVNALLWYPDNKTELVLLAEELMTGSGEERGARSNSGPKDPTGATAIRLAENRRYQTLKQEIEAVDQAVSSLSPEQAVVVRRRFWDYRYSGGRRKPRQYDFMQDLGYSLDGMRKIVRGVILEVASLLGEK